MENVSFYLILQKLATVGFANIFERIRDSINRKPIIMICHENQIAFNSIVGVWHMMKINDIV